jgi:MFS superfamily sulfate permease-like transporter
MTDRAAEHLTEKGTVMLSTMQLTTLLLVALTMTPALAHALELPGKMRLPKNTYMAVQTIYYPGFTIIGAAEFLSLLATLGLLFVTPRDTMPFWLTLSALVALVLMHAIFWVFTQPVNRVWLKGQKLSKAGAAFFNSGGQYKDEASSPDWTVLRNRWESSHVARAVLSLAALALLATAVTAS